MNRAVECMVKCVCRGCNTTVYTSMARVQECQAKCGWCRTPLWMDQEVERRANEAIEDFLENLPSVGGLGSILNAPPPLMVPEDMPCTDNLLDEINNLRGGDGE